MHYGTRVEFSMRRHLGKLSYKNIKLLLVQVTILLVIGWIFLKVASNVHANLQSRGVHLGLDFLKDTAGFGIIFHLMKYTSNSNYFQVFWVGVSNTLLVGFVSIIFSTILGFILGIFRASKNRMLEYIGTGYIEIIRNVPLLLQLFFWYFVVLRSAPYPQESFNVGDLIFFNNRGLYLSWPMASTFSAVMLILSAVSIVMLGYITFVYKKSKKYIQLFFIISFVVFSFLAFHNLAWEKPILGKFNYQGGLNIIPEFLALIFALSIYTAAFIAEIVRMGIQSVSLGQYEAAYSLGLSRIQTIRLIIFPQALKVMLPPLTNQYLNVTKNSSLATAIAFPDLISVFAGTVLNQTGHAIEIIVMTMSVYLFISLILSLMMILYERSSTWKST